MTEVRRNLESGDIYLNHFWTGMITNRSPLFTPISSFGIQMIQRMDALIDGLNMELSPKATLWRRFPYTKFCTAQFGSSEWPLTWTSFRNLSGTIYPIVDTPTHVYQFSGSAITAVYTKGTTAQSSFCGSNRNRAGVGNFLYWCDGNASEKWDGSHQWKWGIQAPSVTPGLSFSVGALSPTAGYSYVYCYYNSVTGHLSSASPVSANTGPLTGKNITVSYTASGDSQVTNIWIFRIADGGGLYYFLASVANATSNYTDSTADTGLNKNLIADLSGVNSPPPAGMAHTAFYAGRPWGLVGNVLYAGAGPDATIGVGTECWPGANNWVLPGQGTALVATSVGLAVFTYDDLYLLAGTDLTSFTLLPWQINFGVAGENSVTQDGDLLFVFTTRSLFYSIQYGQSLSEIGFNLRDKLGAMNSANVYIALHRDGADEGLFVSDGSTNVWRYGLDFGAWSPKAQPLMGAHAISSIETSTGVWTLLLGTGAGSSYIYGRNPSPGSFADDGTAYSAYVTIGNLILAPPGQIATPEKLLVQVAGPVATYTYPAVSVLPNNVSGSFTTLPVTGDDPPQLSGTAYASTNPLCKFNAWRGVQSPLPQQVQSIQVKIDFDSETVQGELLGVGVI